MSNNLFSLHPQLAADSFVLGDMPLSRVLLINDCQFPWVVLVPRRNAIKEIYQLADKDQMLLWQESSALSRVMMAVFHGDKMNIAAIGNMVPQLHLHHVVRYQDDPCWPSPIWGKLAMLPYSLKSVGEVQQKLRERMPELQIADLQKH